MTFDPEMAGRAVSVDGGGEVAGTAGAARETFTGLLTGRRLAYGDPPWVWVEVLEDSPGGEPQTVWCEASFVFGSDPLRLDQPD